LNNRTNVPITGGSSGAGSADMPIARPTTLPIVVTPKTERMPCCVCGDPWTLNSTDYVTVTLEEPNDGTVQWLGAHAACLRRVFTIHVEVGDSQ
jgi:hypothetical protein